MIVLDASALLELVLATDTGRRVADRIADPADDLHVPHLADVEIAQGLRRFVQQGDVDAERAREALADYLDFGLYRHGHEPLLERAWALRDNVSAYDAVYVALAEALDCPLVTCDGRLSRAPVGEVRIELFAQAQ